MASPQPTDPHIVITHNLQENILIRDFSKQQLKIIYLIIRLSWGCGSKVWQYKNYSDFKCIGLHKPDVAKNLGVLRNNKVIQWVERYNLLSFEKDYDLWTIPVKGDSKILKKLIHESLKNIGVSETLTALGNSERCSENTNTTVSETLTQSLVISEHLKPDRQVIEHVASMSKERINKELNIYSTVISYLNDKTNMKYRSTTGKTQTLIRARAAEGFTLDDFKLVIDKKVLEWKGSDMEKYLRPETLFGTKFEGYLNQPSENKGKPSAQVTQQKVDVEAQEYAKLKQMQRESKGAI